jgi:hypothetical protein
MLGRSKPKGSGGAELPHGDHRDDEAVELECPTCGERVKTTAKVAKAGVVRCRRGHEIPLVQLLGGRGPM